MVIPVKAQVFSPSVGISIELKESDLSEAKNGLIVAKDPSQYYLTRSYQDPNVAGVIADETDFLYTTEDRDQRLTIAVDGVADVWVTNELGTIKYGDFITTSTDTGIGVKAIQNGSVIGYALEATAEGDEPQLISVQLALSSSWDGTLGQQSDVFKQSSDTLSKLLSNVESEAQGQSRSFLYLVVILVVVLASIFGFMTFGRIAINGINAVGRNPLAKSTIVKTILINSFITILFTLGSLVIALLIIR